MSLEAAEAVRDLDSPDLESAVDLEPAVGPALLLDPEAAVEAVRLAEEGAWVAWLARRDLRRAVEHRAAGSAGRGA